MVRKFKVKNIRELNDSFGIPELINHIRRASREFKSKNIDMKTLPNIDLMFNICIGLMRRTGSDELVDAEWLYVFCDLLLSLSEDKSLRISNGVYEFCSILPEVFTTISPTTQEIICEALYNYLKTDEKSFKPYCTIPLYFYFEKISSMTSAAAAKDVRKAKFLAKYLNQVNFSFTESSEDPMVDILKKLFLKKSLLTDANVTLYVYILLAMEGKLSEFLEIAVVREFRFCSVNTVNFYSKVCLSAYSNTESSFVIRKQVENIFGQIVKYSMLCENKKITENCRAFIFHWWDKRRKKDVETVVLRLTEVLMFRYLMCANNFVRANAARLLVMFLLPISPDLNKKQQKSKQQEILQTYSNMLDDESDVVRALAVKGICVILREFWLPNRLNEATCRAFLDILLSNLAFDAKSPDVRCAVLEGTCAVLENEFTHPFVREHLGKLLRLLYDKSAKVRRSALKVVVAIAHLRNIGLLEFLQLEELMFLLLVESDEKLKKKIAAIIIETTLSKDSTPEKLLQRIMTMCSRSVVGTAELFRMIPLIETHKRSLMFSRLVFEFALHRFEKSKQKRKEDKERYVSQGISLIILCAAMMENLGRDESTSQFLNEETFGVLQEWVFELDNVELDSASLILLERMPDSYQKEFIAELEVDYRCYDFLLRSQRFDILTEHLQEIMKNDWNSAIDSFDLILAYDDDIKTLFFKSSEITNCIEDLFEKFEENIEKGESTGIYIVMKFLVFYLLCHGDKGDKETFDTMEEYVWDVNMKVHEFMVHDTENTELLEDLLELSIDLCRMEVRIFNFDIDFYKDVFERFGENDKLLEYFLILFIHRFVSNSDINDKDQAQVWFDLFMSVVEKIELKNLKAILTSQLPSFSVKICSLLEMDAVSGVLVKSLIEHHENTPLLKAMAGIMMGVPDLWFSTVVHLRTIEEDAVKDVIELLLSQKKLVNAIPTFKTELMALRVKLQ
ncbi:hypothetical protein PCE1_002481 [Barthelona sp. PCE]